MNETRGRSAMAERPFRIGADAVCADGVCGKVTRVVVDPVARALTHLVVEPRHWPGLGRLVPLNLVDAATPTEVRLRCTRAEFDELDFAEDTHFAMAWKAGRHRSSRPPALNPVAAADGVVGITGRQRRSYCFSSP